MNTNLKRKAGRVLSFGLLVTLFIITFYPFLLMFICSFKYQMQIINNPWFFTLPLHFSNYAKAFIKLYPSIINSIIITALGILIVITTSSMASYSFAYFEYPFKKFLYCVVLMLLMIPGFVLLIPQFMQIKSLGLFNTYFGLALPPAAHYSPMAVMLITTFFKNVPESIIENAKIEGANNWKIFTRIIMPVSKPIIATVSIMSGITIWNNYIWSLVATRGAKVRPVIVELTLLQGNYNEGYGLKLAGYVIASIPVIVLFVFMTKQFVSGLTAGAIKG